MSKLPVVVAAVALACGFAAGCNGTIGDPPSADDNPAPAAYEPGASHLRRLSSTQYQNALRDLFGDEIAIPKKLEPDISIEGLVAVGSSRTSISPRGVEQYEEAAYELAEQAMEPSASRDLLMPCTPTSTTDLACARSAVEALGLRVWRRPLVEAEVDTLSTIAMNAASTLGDFYDGFEFAVAALLQSPHFLFRVELGEPDPVSPNALRYSDYEMASRLSFFLWNSIPDQELLDAAGRGELVTDEGLRAQASRLLASDRARAAVRNFFNEMFELYRLDELVKDPTLFKQMSADVGPSAREETLLTLEHLIFEEQGDYRDILTSRRTFINRKMASLYNVRAPAREGFGMHEWAEGSPRRGLLGQASLLAMHAHPVASSATLRGKFVRKTLLCAVILPPPVNVDTSLPAPSGTTLTLRDRVKEHLVDPACNACHKVMDPIGLALENFDGIGRYRATDQGAIIDPSGEIDGYYFADAIGLAQLVSDRADLGSCLVRTMFRYASGEVETAGSDEVLGSLTASFARAKYRILPLMLELVMHKGFREAVAAPLEGDK